MQIFPVAFSNQAPSNFPTQTSKEAACKTSARILTRAPMGAARSLLSRSSTDPLKGNAADAPANARTHSMTQKPARKLTPPNPCLQLPPDLPVQLLARRLLEELLLLMLMLMLNDPYAYAK